MENADTASAGFVVVLILVIFLFLVTVDNGSSRWNGGQDPNVATAMLVLLIACASLIFISLCMCWLCSMFGKNGDEGGYDSSSGMVCDSMGTLCCL